MKADRKASAARIERDLDHLGTHPFTESPTAISRYAFTPAYARTLKFFVERLDEVGFEVRYDAVGNLVARNRPEGQPVFGIGSHCDSNRNGGKYDGTLGVVVALEVCRLNAELGLGLPLQVISFLEEEGSGFGQVLLGSRVMTGAIGAPELAATTAIDDGRPFFAHAAEAGFQPERWRECERALDDMVGWIEVHIEQGRVLQDHGSRIGIVPAISGYVHADVEVCGRADHAGATPMDMRSDALLVAAELALAVEGLAIEVGAGTVATVGELELQPGLINVVPGRARVSLDVRGTDDAAVRAVIDGAIARARELAKTRGATVSYRERAFTAAAQMDELLVAELTRSTAATGEAYSVLPSGAVHDTLCVAARRPTAMLFVPCLDGISHSPEESADPADAALAAEIVLDAIARVAPSYSDRSKG